MKAYWSLLFATVIAVAISLVPQTSKAQTFLSEGFEQPNPSSPTIPIGWTEEVVGEGKAKWRFQNGGHHTSGSTIGFPANAHTGAFNAVLEYSSIENNHKSKLISSVINLENSIKPVLTFWHAQEEKNGRNDQLRVFYRIAETAQWVPLEEYIVTIGAWTQRTIVLPAEAKVKTFQIAFEGTAMSGFGACLDDIKLEDKGNLNRYVENINTIQYNQVIPSGLTTNPLGYISIFVKGNNQTLPLTNIKINYKGSAPTDIAPYGIKLYYTRDTIFQNTDPITTTGASIAEGKATFTGLNKEMQTGYNYIWVCADINENATPNNTIDFSIEPNDITIAGNNFPATPQNPEQKSIVEKSIFFDTFESPKGWSLSGGIWQQGTPTGAGDKDPKSAFSGTGILATNLNGNYPANITDPNQHTAVTPTINCKYYKNINIRYKRWMNITASDFFDLSLSTDNKQTYSSLEFIYNTYDAIWKNAQFDISSLAYRKDDVTLKLAIFSTDALTEFGGWNLDNFAVTGKYIAHDLQLKRFSQPTVHCGMSTSEPVTVTVKNTGGETISTPFEIGYSLDNGITFVKETVTATINSESEYTYSFKKNADLSKLGNQHLTFQSFLPNDDDNTNDKLEADIYIYPSQDLPYNTALEESNAYWHPYGQNSTWEWGVPTALSGKKANSGTKIWTTNLRGKYNSEEKSYLESPCFNLSGAIYPVLSFYYKLNTQEGIDGFNVEYSINNGNSWELIPAASIEDSKNWNPTATVTALNSAGWSKNTDKYQQAYTLLPLPARNAPAVKFRIVYASNNETVYDGIQLDDINVYDMPIDPGIKELTSPITACEIGTNKQLTFKIQNFGLKPIEANTVIPIKFKVDNGQWIEENITVSTKLNKGDQFSHSTSATFNFRAAGEHKVEAFLACSSDNNRVNDTLRTSVTVNGMPEFTLGPNIGTTDFSNIILDAGAGMATYKWQDNTPTRTYKVTAPGTYSVTITNSVGCQASASVIVMNSDKNTGITSITGLVSACTHSATEKPTITIINKGVTDLNVGYNIPVTVKVNGVEKFTETVVLTAILATNAEIPYTLTKNLDISAKGDYSIEISTSLPDDIDRTNDAQTISISTWGAPTVSFAQSEIFKANPKGTVLTAITSSEVTNYVWRNETAKEEIAGETTSSYTITIPTSAEYSVTVSGSKGCGTAKATVTIHANDLGISEITATKDDTPLGDKLCEKMPIYVKATTTNYGQDTYPIGTKIKITCEASGVTKEEIFELQHELTPGHDVVLTFSNAITLPKGNNNIKVFTGLINDANSSNDSFEKTVYVTPAPTVSIEPEILKLAISPSKPYTIVPTYSEDVTDFLWNDNSTSQNYCIDNYPQYSKYTVIGTTALGCSASDFITIISNDIELSAIKSPTTRCELTNNTPIVIAITNSGSTTYAVGTKIKVTVNIDGTNLAPEEITLLEPLAPQTTIEKTLTTKADLSGKQNAQIEITIEEVTDFTLSNNKKNIQVKASGYPVITLGLDEVVHAWGKVITPGDQFDKYLWKFNNTEITKPATEATHTATQTGNYSVTVTDILGCSATDDINLTFVIDDIKLESIDAPTSSCSLSNNEPIKITVRNTGTTTLTATQTIKVSYTIDGIAKEESLALGAELQPNATHQLTLLGTINFSIKKDYAIEIEATMNGDMQASNNKIAATIKAKTPAFVSLGNDIIQENPPYILKAGEGFASYAWNTGANTSEITVTTSGNYSVTVTNSDGCTASDEINVRFTSQTLAVTSNLISPISECVSKDPKTITVELQNNGITTYAAGKSIAMGYKHNTENEVNETVVLKADLAPGSKLPISFTQKVIANTGENTLKVYLFKGLPDEKTFDLSYTGKQVPTFSFATEKIEVSLPYNLEARGGNSYLWSNGITTANNLVGTPGVYWVQVSLTNGCNIKATIEVVNTNAVGENEFITTLKYYPVPATYILNVEASFKANTELTLQIIDVTGEIKWQNRYEATDLKEAIPLNDLKSGTYILKVTTPQGTASKAFIINK